MKCCCIALYLTDKLALSKGTVFSGMSRQCPTGIISSSNYKLNVFYKEIFLPRIGPCEYNRSVIIFVN